MKNMALTESWTEIRCPACVMLGWEASRMLYKVYGKLPETDAKLQIKCHRCKSVVEWTIGKPILIPIVLGPKVRKRQTAAFE